MSVFVSYSISGDIGLSYYHNFGFILVKVFQSFMRGSIDSVDQDLKLDIYDNTDPDPNLQSFKSLSKYAFGNSSIVNQVGVAGFMIYSFLFYLFSYSMIKVAHSGYFLFEYRENYLQAESEKELERKKVEALEKKKKLENKKNV